MHEYIHLKYTVLNNNNNACSYQFSLSINCNGLFIVQINIIRAVKLE